MLVKNGIIRKEDKHEKLSILLLIIISAIPSFLVVKNLKITPDSMRFALVSQQLLSGNGIRVPIIRLEDNYLLLHGTVPFLDQMPLLPILFAILGGVTPDKFLPAQIINLLSHIMTSLFTFLLTKRVSNNTNVALLTGILVSTSLPLLSISQYMWSEPLFIALTIASIYLLTTSRNKGSKYLISSSLITCLAILTRNAGIAIIPLFIFETINIYKSKRRGYIGVVSTILPVITAISLFLRNYLLSGSIRGFNYPPPERTFREAFIGVLGMIFAQFQLGTRSTTIVILLIVLSIPFILLYIRKGFSFFYQSGLDLLVIFIICYTTLVIFTMATSQYAYELRYMSPLVPFLFIVFVSSILLGYETMHLYSFHKTANTWLITCLLALTIGNAYKTVINIPELSYKQEKHYEILNLRTYKWVKEKLSKDAIITTNRPFHLSFFGGYSTVALPHKRFDPRIPVPGDMESFLPKQMKHFGSQFIVLFEGAEERYDGKYIARLFNNRENDKNFDLIYESADGVVYKLKIERNP